MSASNDSEAGVGLDARALGRSGDTEPASEAPAAARRFPFGRLRTWLLLRLLFQYHDALWAQDKLDAAESVLDLMDEVYGYCSARRRLR